MDDSCTRMLGSRSGPSVARGTGLVNAQRQAVVPLHNVSGGVLAGDSLRLSIDAGSSTLVQVTSVGATRVYRHRAGRRTAAYPLPSA